MSWQYADIHTHLNFAAFDNDRDEVIARAQESNTLCINVGTQLDTSRKAIALAERFEGMYASVGLHPIHTSKSFHDASELGEGGSEFVSRGEEIDITAYQKLATHPKVVAIGECGLDYYRLESDTKEKQQQAFVSQIAIARELRKPLMLHIRNAYHDAYEILKSEWEGVSNLHFFAGSVDEARMFLNLGCTFSFTGVITFAESYHEVIRFLPLDRIMSETDAPYVPPVPYRGQRNEPSYVQHVVHKIAEIKGIPTAEVKEALLGNAYRTFMLG